VACKPEIALLEYTFDTVKKWTYKTMNRRRVLPVIFSLFVVGAYFFIDYVRNREPINPGSPTTFRRLSEDQYHRAIAEVFGDQIEIPGRFEPPLREEGLLAIGNAHASITPYGFEQFEIRAGAIAGQVINDIREKKHLDCE